MLSLCAGHYSRGDSYYSDDTDDNDSSAKISALEDLLATKLAEYLSGTFYYSFTKLLSSALTNLYRGPSESNTIAKSSNSNGYISFYFYF